jgi:hypothetical protein
MAITIPDTHYIGINLNRTSDDIPLGFLTPGGTDSAAKKRAGTVNSWCGVGSGQMKWVYEDEWDKYEKENPDAVMLREMEPQRGNTYKQRQYKIPNKAGEQYKILDNVPNDPQLGFRITKMVSRYGGWHGGNKLVRIEDPRGFELEISVDNLVKIMTMTTFIEGVCQTECVWGREGANNVLLPVNSEPYMEARKVTDYRNTDLVPLKELNYGDVVELKKTEQFNGLTGEYMGAYNVYHLVELNADASMGRSGYLYSRSNNKKQHRMIKAFRRYVIRITDKKTREHIYVGVATAKVHKVIEKVDTPLQRFDIDPDKYSESNYVNGGGMPFAVSLKKMKEEDLASTFEWVPVDTEEVMAASRKIKSGAMAFWAKETSDGTRMMRLYKTWFNDYHRKADDMTREEHDRIFVGQFTKINAPANEWSMTGEKGKDGVGVFQALTKPGGKQSLLIEDHNWFRLAFTINGKKNLVPLTKTGVYF